MADCPPLAYPGRSVELPGSIPGRGHLWDRGSQGGGKTSAMTANSHTTRGNFKSEKKMLWASCLAAPEDDAPWAALIDWYLDHGGENLDWILRCRQKRILVSEGFYLATLESTDLGIVASTGNPGIRLTFSLIGGRPTGKLVDHTLYLFGRTLATTRKLAVQILVFNIALGIATRDANGAIRSVPGKTFQDAIGRSCVLDLVVEPRTNRWGRHYLANAVRFCGIYSPEGICDPKP